MKLIHYTVIISLLLHNVAKADETNPFKVSEPDTDGKRYIEIPRGTNNLLFDEEGMCINCEGMGENIYTREER